MAEHSELVAEMLALEQMGTQERQKLAKKRRLQQLKKWSQREKEWISKEKQLNKRLANMLHEENNGLNLKQYTSYNSSSRIQKQSLNSNNNSNHMPATNLKLYTDTNNNNNNNTSNNSHSGSANSHHHNHAHGETRPQSSTKALRVTPNGRVQFNAGVMLLEAATRNDFNEVKRLLMLGVSPDSVNHDGLTALHQCCIDASEPMMKLLLDFGADVDATDTEQWTPLHAACTCGHLNLVKVLVEHNADLLAVNGDGNMPFDICEDEATLDYIESQMVERGITQEMIDYTRASTENQMLSDIEKLLKEGKHLNPANDTGVTPLHVAAANGYTSVVKILVQNGVDVNICDSDRWQPIHGTACWGNDQHIKVLELLVEAGARLDGRTINDETVFDLCDNVELLERMNQLKDELESKQNSITNPLRRTQSKNNSRIHSVRRTSVRDKNQISRREAREEAMLRVDSDSKTNGSADNAQNRPQTDPTNLNNKVSSMQSDPTKRGADSVKSSSCEHLAPSEKDPPSTAVDEARKLLRDNGGDNFRSTEAYDSGTHFASSNNDNNGVSSKSQSSSSDSIGSKRRHLVKNDQVDSSDPTRAANGLSSQTASSHLLSSSTTTTISQSIVSAYSSASNNNIDKENYTTYQNGLDYKTQTNLKKKNEPGALNSTGTISNETINSNSNDREAQAKTNCDQTATNTQQANANHLPQSSGLFNYTLSNLKKQRSDLRMRTTSISGQPVDGSASSPVSLCPSVAVTTSNGARSVSGRPGSPGPTFRKFSGELSELIGGNDQTIRYKCCTLM